MSRSWHGVTGGAASNTYSSSRKGYGPPQPGALILPAPDTYRSRFIDDRGVYDWQGELEFGFELVDRQSSGALAVPVGDRNPADAGLGKGAAYAGADAAGADYIRGGAADRDLRRLHRADEPGAVELVADQPAVGRTTNDVGRPGDACRLADIVQQRKDRLLERHGDEEAEEILQNAQTVECRTQPFGTNAEGHHPAGHAMFSEMGIQDTRRTDRKSVV